MTAVLRWLGASLLVALVAFGAWLALPEILEREPAEVPFEVTEALVDKGRYLAQAGNCLGCHTAAGGTPYAGGRAITTPFGSVFSTNLTPDPDSGLGAWSSADFWRAMHYGKSRDGRRLYPAFPYPDYTRVTREDTDAIFAYLRSLDPVSSPRVPPDLKFPQNTELALIFWRALYFRAGELTPDTERSAEWNRGAYLVQGLGHCGACHTARTLLGGSDTEAGFSGGAIPTLGWDALPLTLDRPMTDEDAAEMAAILKTGVSSRGVASGPMAEVVFQSLQHLNAADIDAMVAYIRTLEPRAADAGSAGPPVSSGQRRDLVRLGGALYAEHCTVCHGDDGEGEAFVYPALAGNRLVTARSPNNALTTVVLGGFAPSTTQNPRPYGMPSYAHQLTDDEIAAVLTYLRSAWGNAAPAVSPEAVRRR